MNSLQILKFYAGGLSKELKCESKIQACDMIDDDVEKVFKNFLKFIYSYAFKNRFTYIFIIQMLHFRNLKKFVMKISAMC